VRELLYTSRFRKDLRRELKDPRNKNLASELKFLFDLLVNEVPIPQEFHEHQLKGNYIGHFESHLRPDLLIIYRFVEPNELIAIRLGSHADLF
jgi:mRNA interferase YafQ